MKKKSISEKGTIISFCRIFLEMKKKTQEEQISYLLLKLYYVVALVDYFSFPFIVEILFLFLFSNTESY